MKSQWLRNRGRAVAAMCSLAILLAIAAPAGAQEFRANLTGTVKDPQGGAIPGATDKAVNVDTNVSTEAVTNGEGSYFLPQLSPGRYRLTVALQGFKTFAR